MPRLHSLDALRAAMMLLGLVLHSAVSYLATPVPEAWPYQDAQTSALFDWIVFVIHLFRMPTFFVMSGFFTAFLYQREGPAGFLWHRARRVLLPLVVSWLVLFPPMRAGFIFARAGGGAAGLEVAMAALTRAPYEEPLLIHLWFLHFLFIYCIAAWALAPLVALVPAALRTRVVDAYAALAPRAAGCVAFALLSAATMLPMVRPALDTSFTFVPSGRVLLAYAVFFAFGWLLYLRQDVIPALARHPWRYLTAGLVAAVTYLVVVLSVPFGVRGTHVAGVVVGGLAMWLLIYGVTGAFVRYFAQPRPLQRYLADASYWMYLVHLPFVLWFQGALAPWRASAVLKFAIVLAGVTFITVVSYHYLVRATAVGMWLNGRRFERALPRLAAS